MLKIQFEIYKIRVITLVGENALLSRPSVCTTHSSAEPGENSRALTLNQRDGVSGLNQEVG